jgi:tRNA(adenine34) deaminase
VTDSEGRILTRGRNRIQEISAPIGQAFQSNLAHAELNALLALPSADASRRSYTLFTVLEPCPMCAGAIVMAQVDACFFAAYDARQGCCGSVYDIPRDPAFSHRTRIVGGILEEEAKALLQEFFNARRLNPS